MTKTSNALVRAQANAAQQLCTPAPKSTMPSPKKTQLIGKLRCADGVSIDELSEQFGWQPHSTRAMLSGLRKAGHAIERAKQGSVTVYRIAG